jgi:hypothetical protein
MRRRGTRHEQLLNDVKENNLRLERGNNISHSVESRFGRSYGPVARRSMNDGCHIVKILYKIQDSS